MSIKHLHIYKQWRSVGNNTAISFLPRSRRRSKVDFQCATKGAYTNISIQKKNLYYIIKSGHQNFFKLSLVAYIKAWILKKQDYETRRYIMPIYIHAPTKHFLPEGRYMLEVVRSGWWVPLQASSIYLIFHPAISYLVKAILAAHEPLDCFHRQWEGTTPPLSPSGASPGSPVRSGTWRTDPAVARMVPGHLYIPGRLEAMSWCHFWCWKI